ncbi:hypothetical protein FOL47_005678, partial [Perkinsus chesapeaki]
GCMYCEEHDFPLICSGERRKHRCSYELDDEAVCQRRSWWCCPHEQCSVGICKYHAQDVLKGPRGFIGGYPVSVKHEEEDETIDATYESDEAESDLGSDTRLELFEDAGSESGSSNSASSESDSDSDL